ncbi:MAG: hypothetical protein AAGC60_18355 [Acidobacteriota bacterium]
MTTHDIRLVVLHAATTFLLVGLIWTVQVVQYPLFAQVGADQFVSYHAGHSARISLLVVPLMLVELVTACLLLVRRPAELSAGALWLGLALLSVVWLSTFALQVPRHGILGGGFDAAAHRTLVATNWLRTAAWSGRGLVVVWQLRRLLS